MPNWCQQYGEVRGPNTELKRFLEAIRENKPEDTSNPEWIALKPETISPSWDMNQLFPIPEALRNTVVGGFMPDEHGNKTSDARKQEEQQLENIVNYGYKDWYQWALDNWDSKWGACDVEIDEDMLDDNTSEVLHINWKSAWSPVVGLIRKISEQFPLLLFGFHMTEEANFFAGFMVIQNGVVIEEHDYDMETQPQLLIDDPTDEQREKHYIACTDWSDMMLFEIAELMNDSMNEIISSKSSWK